jgi:ferredoxin
MGVLVFSADPVALDATVCRLVGVDPSYVPTIEYGRQAGLGTYLEEEITLVGDPFERFVPESFDAKREPVHRSAAEGKLGFLFKLFQRILPKPVIKGKCAHCGVCVDACPAKPKALQWENRSKDPTFNYQNCIRCFCCQELCPHSAITIHEPFIRRFLIR